jgi:hypothetical protein
MVAAMLQCKRSSNERAVLNQAQILVKPAIFTSLVGFRIGAIEQIMHAMNLDHVSEQVGRDMDTSSSSGDDFNQSDDEEIDEDQAFNQSDWQQYGDWFHKETDDAGDEGDDSPGSYEDDDSEGGEDAGLEEDDEGGADGQQQADDWLVGSEGTGLHCCTLTYRTLHSSGMFVHLAPVPSANQTGHCKQSQKAAHILLACAFSECPIPLQHRSCDFFVAAHIN